MEQGGGTVVDGELACFECLYDLRGQPAEGACPECGLAVVRSLGDDRWDRADRGWRRCVRWGVAWSLAEYVTLVVVVLVANVARFSSEWGIVWMYGGMGVCAAGGGWVTAVPEPWRGGERGWRWAVRLLSVAVGAMYAGVIMAALAWDGAEVGGVAIAVVVVVGLFLLNGVKQAVQLAYVRRLLARVPGRPMRRVSLACIGVPLVGWWGVIPLTYMGWTHDVVWRMVLVAVSGMLLATAIYEWVVWRVLGRGAR